MQQKEAALQAASTLLHEAERHKEKISKEIGNIRQDIDTQKVKSLSLLPSSGSPFNCSAYTLLALIGGVINIFFQSGFNAYFLMWQVQERWLQDNLTLRKRVEELKEVVAKREALCKDIGNMQVMQLRQ